MVRDRLLQEGTLQLEDLWQPDPASVEDTLLVHTKDYVTRLCDGSLTVTELRRLGLPWSEALVQRSFYAVGGRLRRRGRLVRKASVRIWQAARITLSPIGGRGFAC